MENLIRLIKAIDTQLFLKINGLHNDFFDVLMFWISHKFFWIPLYVLLLYITAKQFRKKTWLVVLCIGLLIVASDQLSVHGFKEVFLRYRPCHNLNIQSQVHLLNGYCGGTYGFVSSHAANTFALAMFLFLLLKSSIKHIGWYLFGWASVVGYSRIYSGVHYPADIVIGAVLGMGLGIVFFKIYTSLSNRLNG